MPNHSPAPNPVASLAESKESYKLRDVLFLLLIPKKRKPTCTQEISLYIDLR